MRLIDFISSLWRRFWRAVKFWRVLNYRWLFAWHKARR